LLANCEAGYAGASVRCEHDWVYRLSAYGAGVLELGFFVVVEGYCIVSAEAMVC